ncbi:MAG: hypothetical protein ACFFBS_05180 [Promethearchaeota archaeon]
MRKRDDGQLDGGSPLAFIVLSIVFVAAGIILMWFFLFIAIISFFIAFVWFVTGYAHYRRLKEEKSRGRTRF